MFKKVVLFLVAYITCLSIEAQDHNSVSFKIESGFDLKKPGIFLNIEPRVKPSIRTFLGLRCGLIAYSGTEKISTIKTQITGNNDQFQYTINEKAGNGIVSLLPTFGYYLNENVFLQKHIYRPFFGLGLGYYILTSPIEGTRTDQSNNLKSEFKGQVASQYGMLFRTGIEFEKLIIGISYNFTPKNEIELTNDEIIGNIDLSFVEISLGFFIDLSSG